MRSFATNCSAAASTSQIPAGLVLAGGGAQLRGLVELAETIVPSARAHRGAARARRTCPKQVSQPEYATVVGLVLYGAQHAAHCAAARPAKFVGKLKSMFAGAS